ncbi:MAG: hypothetical protein HQ595_01710, partial [Candidatus Omnitrophica bacterium]|nr:hypothetical protein [Candidatus Omnitrophota bacterium]
LLYHYLKSRHLEVSLELQELKIHARNYIPKTVEAVQIIENNMKNLQLEKAYGNLLELSAILKQESGTSSIVILDDFHCLDSYKIQSPFGRLAKEIMIQKDTMYIFISAQVNYAKRILASELSLLFGNFETVHLEHFDYSTSCKFLQQRFHDIELPKDLRDFLINFSKGHPFYLDTLSNKLLEQAKQLNKQEINRGLIAQAFNATIYDSKGILNQYFANTLSHNLNGADYVNFIPILLSASERACCLSDISRQIKRQPKALSKQIGYLLSNDLLSKIGVFYRIQDRLFRFWLKSVYQRKNLSLDTDLDAESRQFSEEIEEQISYFSQQTKTKTLERVIDLCKSFNNEIVMIQNKSFRLWHFEEICPWPKENLQNCLLARYKEGSWLFWIMNEEVNELQLQEFIQATRESGCKIRRAIIIAFQELDLNVRLVALEKKIWIWTPTDLNLLLDLYGKQQLTT